MILNQAPSGMQIYTKIAELIREKHPFILCTVTNATGSTPQKGGSIALFNENGLIEGTLGGGIVEKTMETRAKKALPLKESGHYWFNLKNDISSTEQAICGGEMKILMDAEPDKHIPQFAAIERENKNHLPGVLVSVINKNADGPVKIARKWVSKKSPDPGIPGLTGETVRALEEMLKNPIQGDFREFEYNDPSSLEQTVILEGIVPLPRLIIAGAGHVGKALSHLGRLIGFEVTVWDDREEYSTQKNLPDAHNTLNCSASELADTIKADKNTFIVIATPGHKKDADVLKSFVTSDAGYIGMIGSKKKVALVRQQFLDKGWATTEQWERIYSPIGLKINSKTVQEIAVSIAAQLITVRAKLHSHEG